MNAKRLDPCCAGGVPFVLLLAGILLLCASAMAASTPGWQIVPSTNNGSQGNHLYGVSAVAGNDLWAVGDYNDGPYKYFARTLSEHWDGSQWVVIPSPNLLTGGDASNILRAVTAISSDDVWAVGSYSDLSGVNEKTLIIHWDGSAWSVVPSPNPLRVSSLYGIFAISADDIWAVGYESDSQSQAGSLTVHWDGTEWSAIPNPGESTLRGVTAISTNDVWAVSESSEFLHWDGSSWRVFYGPQRFNGYLEAVTAISSNDVWAVGYKQVVYNQNTITLHWNGRRWNTVSAVNPQDEAGFYGLAALSSDSVWAVGFQSGKPLVEKWDGNRWSVSATPSVGTFPTFQGATFIPRTRDFWAVGWDYQQSNVAKTMTEIAQF